MVDAEGLDGGDRLRSATPSLRSPRGLLASLRVLDLSGDDGDSVTRLLADLGADVLKVEPPGGSPSRTKAPTLRGSSLRFALHNANKRSTVLDPGDSGDRERLIELAGSRRHRRRQRYSRSGRGVRNFLRSVGRPVPAAGGTVGHRLRQNRAAVVMAGDRSGALCAVGSVVAVGTDRRDTGIAAGRHRLGHCRRSSRVGGAGRVLQPITLRDRRLHRLLPVRRGCDGARPRVRGARAGRCGHASPQPVARTPEKPGRLPDLSLPGRLCPALRDVAAPMARATTLVGGARRSSRTPHTT